MKDEIALDVVVARGKRRKKPRMKDVLTFIILLERTG